MVFDKTSVKSFVGLDGTSSRSFRAQFWSFDLIFAVVIFCFAITILAYTWFNINNQLASEYSSTSILLQLQAQTLSQGLMSPGAPGNWQNTVNTLSTPTWSGVSVGLATAQSSSSISASKLYTFMSMANYNYLATKPPLGVAFDYYITIVSPSAANAISISIGKNPSTNGALATYAQKMSATLNGIPVVVTVNVWTGTAFALG
jgi:hypothetical protein